MAKKKDVAEVSLTDLRAKLKGIVPFGEQMDKSDYTRITEWIHTGNYNLNAAISGSLFRGFPNARSGALMGESGTGKTFLLLNVCREAQRMGYHILYFDTEGAIDEETVRSFGVDPTRLDHEPVSDLAVLKTALTTICKNLVEAKLAGHDTPKILICLDSLGMLASTKEIEDAMSGSDKADFTKAKLVRALFRLITNDLTGLKIPFIYTNHTYQGIGMYPETNPSGGKGQTYSPSVMLNLTKGKLKEDSEQTGIVVSARPHKNRLAKPGVARFHIRFKGGMNPYIGLEEYISWETCGIQKGKILTGKDVDGKDAKKAGAVPFELDGKPAVFLPGAASYPRYAVRHLGKSVTASELFTSAVFTQEVLEAIDVVVQEKFRYSAEEDPEEIENLLRDGEEAAG